MVHITSTKLCQTECLETELLPNILLLWLKRHLPGSQVRFSGLFDSSLSFIGYFIVRFLILLTWYVNFLAWSIALFAHITISTESDVAMLFVILTLTAYPTLSALSSVASSSSCCHFFTFSRRTMSSAKSNSEICRLVNFTSKPKDSLSYWRSLHIPLCQLCHLWLQVAAVVIFSLSQEGQCHLLGPTRRSVGWSTSLQSLKTLCHIDAHCISHCVSFVICGFK